MTATGMERGGRGGLSSAAEHQAVVDALVVERQELHVAIEANRRLLVQALHDQGVAAGTKP